MCTVCDLQFDHGVRSLDRLIGNFDRLCCQEDMTPGQRVTSFAGALLDSIDDSTCAQHSERVLLICLELSCAINRLHSNQDLPLT